MSYRVKSVDDAETILPSLPRAVMTKSSWAINAI